MHRLHVAAGIDAGAAGSLADLLDQARLEPIDIGVGEKPVDALVGRDVLHEVVDHRQNAGIAAKPIIERSRASALLPARVNASSARAAANKRARSVMVG